MSAQGLTEGAARPGAEVIEQGLVLGVYRALAEHAEREAYPEAVEQAHADFAALQAGEVSGPRLALPDRASP